MAKKKLILNESVTRRFMKLATIKPTYVSNFLNEAEEEEMGMEEEPEEDMGMEPEEGAEEEPMEDPELEAEDEMEDPVGEEGGAPEAEGLVMDLLAKVQEFAQENGVSMELEGDEGEEGEEGMEMEPEGEEGMEMDDAELEGGDDEEAADMEAEEPAEEGGEEELALQEKIVAEVTKRVARRLLNAAKRK